MKFLVDSLVTNYTIIGTKIVTNQEGSMTKSELIEQVAEKIEGLTKKQTEIIVNEVLESIKNALASSDSPRVEIRGFGSFKVKQRRSRDGRNPKTGMQVSIEAKKVPVFKAGKELRERVDVGSVE
jgi:integration host factor subunit beta